MKVIRLRNTNIEIEDSGFILSINIHTLETFIHPEETDYVQFNDKALVKFDNVQDEEGNTFASAQELLDYTKTLQNQVPSVGEALKIGNIELRSTGGEILQINSNTGRKTLNVFQEITSTGTSKVFFRNQESSTFVDEDSTTAYNPISSQVGTSVLNAQGRYVIALDILVSGSKFTQGYRSKSPTGLVNGNIKVFNISQTPEDVTKYNELTGTNISAGWYISKAPHWKYRTEAEIDNNAGFNLTSGDIELPLSEGFDLVDNEVYRFVISADNEFTMDGFLSGPLVTGEEGATQFVPYLERTYFGQAETQVVTYGSRSMLGLDVDFRRDHTDTTILLDSGDAHAVNSIIAYELDGYIAIGSVDGGTPLYTNISPNLVTFNGGQTNTTLNGVINQLNALFQVTPLALGGDYVSTLPVLDGVDVTANFAEGQVPIAGGIYGVASDTSQHGARVWSDETIDAAGEYYEVKITGKGQFMLGLYSVDDGDLTEILNNSGNGHSGYKWANAFYNYGSYIAPWTTYGSNSGLSYGPGWSFSGNDQMLRYKQQLQDNFVNGDPVLFKVGIEDNGKISVWYFDEGITNTYIRTASTSYTLPAGNYGLLVKLVNGSVRLVETPKRVAVDPTAPILSYNFIESPDGNFAYPLFATEEEANYVDTQNGGGGTSHQHVYADDAIAGRIWYMPSTGGEMSGTVAPNNTTEITYNEIQTQADDLFRPSLYSSNTITVNEGDSLNLNIHPLDANFVTSIGSIPAFSLDSSGTLLQGTAPQVTGDNVANPYDEYTVTVYRTNSFGTSPNPTELANGEGVLTIRVMNLTAPVVVPITGFTHDATSTALIDTDTLDDGSLVNMDETLDDIRRLVILKTYVEANILPNVQTTGAKYYIGSLNSGADVSSVEDADFDFAFCWEYQSPTSHKFRIIRDGSQIHSVGIGSYTNAVYDYAIELQGTSAYMIACNVNSINTEPSPAHGGSFSHAYEITTIDATAPITLSFAAVGTTADISTTGLSEIIVPRPSNWIQSTAAAHVLSFEGSTAMPTLQAGYTYRILQGNFEYDDQSTATGLHADDVIRFTADGSTEYTGMTVTRVGTPGVNGSYIEFTLPTDVPPLWFYTDHDGVNQNNGITISGSTYVVPVTGVTQEGPVANQTGNNWFNQGQRGWISVDESVSAGERITFNTAWLTDLIGACSSSSYEFYMGFKDTNWSDSGNLGYPNDLWEGGVYLKIVYTQPTIYLTLQGGGYSHVTTVVDTQVASSNIRFFFEVTSSGNSIRAGISNLSTGDDLATTAYADWSNKKVQTGNQGFGITSIDFMVYGQCVFNNTPAIDLADIDWTSINEVSVPTVAVTNLTSWAKALDFSGSAERAQQVSSNTNYMPIGMDGLSAVAGIPSTSGNTSGSVYSRPWACTIVFSPDYNNSNQHIWNQGEGSGNSHDNIYLRLSSDRRLYFGWGRDGALNELYLGTLNPNIDWYGVYIASNGTRLAGTNATPNNLANCFDVRLLHSGNNFGMSTYNWSNNGASTGWNSSFSTTGGRMDRSVTGNFTIGGRGANRNFHGKVASMVVTTLRINQPMPTDDEIKLMITDPTKWLQDYKVGNPYRVASSQAEATFGLFSYLSNAAFATQVWLMGDGPLDNYSNMIRNIVYSNDQNYTKLNMISMVSNDIQNVTIPGLS